MTIPEQFQSSYGDGFFTNSNRFVGIVRDYRGSNFSSYAEDEMVGVKLVPEAEVFASAKIWFEIIMGLEPRLACVCRACIQRKEASDWFLCT